MSKLVARQQFSDGRIGREIEIGEHILSASGNYALLIGISSETEIVIQRVAGGEGYVKHPCAFGMIVTQS